MLSRVIINAVKKLKLQFKGFPFNQRQTGISTKTAFLIHNFIVTTQLFLLIPSNKGKNAE